MNTLGTLKSLALVATLGLAAASASAQLFDYSSLPAGVAWHNASPLQLGPTWTAEAGPGVDINDGVAPSPLVRGAAATVLLDVNGPAIARMWIDMNGNGVFEPAELLINDAPLGFAGFHLLGFNIPMVPAPGAHFVRIRISNVPGLAPVGPAPTGEVSDFIWWIN